MRYCQIVMGPAGSGKSTFCHVIQKHCEAIGRNVHIVNLDPAAEQFRYEPSLDIKDLISVEDVMSELNYGPNGGLVYCMEHLIENIDWLQDEVGSYEDDYLIFDCPGQIELYFHVPLMRQLTDALQQWGYYVCGLYLLDSQFIADNAKFLSGSLMCLSAMIRLEIPHINVLTKCDLIKSKSKLERFLSPDARTLVDDIPANHRLGKKFARLNEAVATVLDDYSMVSFLPLDPTDPESIQELLTQIDNAIQFGEDEEVRDLDPTEVEPEDLDEAAANLTAMTGS